MGGREGGSRLLDQAEAAGAEGSGTGAPFGLNQVGTGSHQIHGQLLLLVKGQHVGHGHRKHHLRQQGPGAAGELEHLLGPKDAALGVESIEVADLDEDSAGSHGGWEELRVHGRHTDRQLGTGLRHGAHQGGFAGDIHEIGPTGGGGPGDLQHRNRIPIGQTSDHLEQPAGGDSNLEGRGQAGGTHHRNGSAVLA